MLPKNQQHKMLSIAETQENQQMKKLHIFKKEKDPPAYELNDVLTAGLTRSLSPTTPQTPPSEYLNPSLLQQFIEMRPRSASVLNTIQTLKSLPLSTLVQEGFTILHIAIWRDDVEHTKKLVENGAPLNSQNHKGETPLHLASFTGNAVIVQLLLQHNANMEAKDLHDQTPLHVAAFLEYTEIVKLLIRQGANIEATSHYMTALHIAARWGRVEIVNKLLSFGANVGAKDRYGWTPLHKAAFFGVSVEVVRMLLEKGADLLAKNREDQTPYDLAKSERHGEIADVIKEEAKKQGKSVDLCYVQ